MSDKIFCCPDCGQPFILPAGERGVCPDDGAPLIETRAAAAQWNRMSYEEQDRILYSARRQSVSRRRPASAPPVSRLLPGIGALAALLGFWKPAFAVAGILLGFLCLPRDPDRRPARAVIIAAAVIFALSSSFREPASAEASSDTAPQAPAESTAAAGVALEEKAAPASEATAIDPQVLFSQDGLTVTATEYVQDRIWGDGIKLLLENAGERDLLLGCTALMVNDYMISELFSSTVAAGKKSNETLYLSASSLRAAGIDNVGKVEVVFHISDAGTYESIAELPLITIRTNRFDAMDTAVSEEGTELYSAGGVRIEGRLVDEDSFWGASVLLYIENLSDAQVSVTCEDMSINGFMVTPFFYENIYPGKKCIGTIDLLSSDLESNGITSIEEIELKFRILNADTYAVIGESGPIRFSPSP